MVNFFYFLLLLLLFFLLLLPYIYDTYNNQFFLAVITELEEYRRHVANSTH